MTLLNAVALGLALACLLAALLFIGHGLRSRRRRVTASYEVGRLEERRSMQMAVVRGVTFLLAGLVFWAIFGLSRRPGLLAPLATATPQPLATSLPAASPTPPLPSQTATSRPVASSTPARTPTTPPEIPTQTPSPLPTATATARPPSATVSSPNGLYLRDAPGGDQILELIADGTELILLPGRETVEELEWQQVSTPAGNQGWVAADYLIFLEEPQP